MNSPISKYKLSGRSRRYLQADLILPELAVFITLVVATLMITWSVILSIGNSILGGYGDNIYFILKPHPLCGGDSACGGAGGGKPIGVRLITEVK